MTAPTEIRQRVIELLKMMKPMTKELFKMLVGFGCKVVGIHQLMILVNKLK